MFGAERTFSDDAVTRMVTGNVIPEFATDVSEDEFPAPTVVDVMVKENVCWTLWVPVATVTPNV